MRKGNITIGFNQRFLLLLILSFFISNLAFAEGGISIINSLNYEYVVYDEDEESEAEKAKKRYIKSMRACKGYKRAPAAIKRKVVALTFDDGPNGRHTYEVLNILNLEDIKATFFVVGNNVKNQPNIVKAAYADGHVIANHSFTHCYLTGLSKKKIEDELARTSNLIEDVIGKYPLLFRPPYGSCSAESTLTVGDMGFKTIMWSAMVDDYNPKTNPKRIADKILGMVTPGTIIGLHDGGGNRKKTVKALPIIISELKRRGYEFVTIPELLGVPAYSYYARNKQPRKTLVAKK